MNYHQSVKKTAPEGKLIRFIPRPFLRGVIGMIRLTYRHKNGRTEELVLRAPVPELGPCWSAAG